ncbi:hypothetical protein DC498_17660 [Terrimonas sp.]|uniref:hypothetical protein n=1 Tax=Terrimonas sp. TaxID=1914338 RepID=UPI000D51CF5F|nr:hypothetical protein [Terrimonas sp.]PVD50799.1 hypothetical protein DC498_17660 [Terrimonas sp.]
MYKSIAEAQHAQGPFGDQKLNELTFNYVKETDPAKKSEAYKKLEKLYPGSWGPNNTISEQADFLIDSYNDSLKNTEDENGETFGDDLT